MDSFTQIVLGAAVGEAVAGKKIGNKALVYGAIAGTIPDLDVFVGDFMSTVGALDFHRGFTHSLAFALIFSPLFAFLMRLTHPKSSANFKDWFMLYFLGFVTHALLDCFTTWGTQILWPFDYRVAFKSIFVIDPLYTIPFFACLVWLAFLPRTSQKRKRLNTIGLTVSTTYLLLSVVIKSYANGVYEQSFKNENFDVFRYDSRPAPLTTFLWAANAEVKDGYYIGYYGLFDDDQKVNYFYFPKRHELIDPYREDDEVKRLLEIMNGWYAIEESENGIVLNDLRFGQRTGWIDADGDFVFSYTIRKDTNDNIVVSEVQKDFDDGSKIINALWSRIIGNE